MASPSVIIIDTPSNEANSTSKETSSVMPKGCVTRLARCGVDGVSTVLDGRLALAHEDKENVPPLEGLHLGAGLAPNKASSHQYNTRFSPAKADDCPRRQFTGTCNAARETVHSPVGHTSFERMSNAIPMLNEAGGRKAARATSSGIKRKVWSDEHDSVLYKHLHWCVETGAAPDWENMAADTDRTIDAVRAHINKNAALRGLYEKAKANAKASEPAPGIRTGSKSSNRGSAAELVPSLPNILAVLDRLKVKVVDNPVVHAGAFKCMCTGLLLVKPSTSAAKNWGPDYRFPFYIACSNCSKYFTLKDLEKAVTDVTKGI